MINVLLDALPTGYEDESTGTFYPLDFDFRIGIQVCLIQDDSELDDIEKIVLMQDLIFAGDRPDDPGVIKDCISFYTNGWYHDRHVEDGKRKVKSSDFDVDQWRIYAAFLAQYGIDLNSVETMHYWVFMGLLSNLQECAYTRVMDIRNKTKIPKGLKGEDLQNFKNAKATYALGIPNDKEAHEEFLDLRSEYFGSKYGGRGVIDTSEVSDEEKERIEIFESYADKE